MINDKNKMKNYLSICKEKGYTAYDYQGKFLSNPDFDEPVKPLVLAFGTNGGKTTTTIIKMDIFYSNPKNKNKKTVLFPHATNVLKNNFADSLDNYGDKSFTYCIANNTEDIKNFFESDCQVLVVLPQSLRTNLDILQSVTWVIVDEAHEWYFAPFYQKILNKLRPEYQLLLTGTPAKFNNKPDQFLYYHVAVDELRKVGKAGNVRIEIVSSNYDLENQDILNSGNVHSRTTNNPNKTKRSLEIACRQMLKTLTNPTDYRVKPINDVFGTVFKELKKTLLVCNSQSQAKQFFWELNKALPNQVLKSLSDDGGNSEEFDMFKKNDDIKVLIVVRKGRLGFDMSNLQNVVDFTLSTNVDVISQMLGRVLRLGDGLKYYFKVSPQNTVWFFEAIMMVVLRLTMQDAYEIYDGNQNQVRIPKSRKNKRRGTKGENGPKRERTLNFRAIDTDLILDLDFFRKVFHKGGEAFQTVSWTTLDEVRKECLNLRDRFTGERTYEECLEVAKKYTRKIDFQTCDVAIYTYAFNRGWMNNLVKDAKLSSRKLTLTYDECKEIADTCSSRREFALKSQPKYKKAKQMGWLIEWFPEKLKTGARVGHEGYNKKKSNFTLNNK